MHIGLLFDSKLKAATDPLQLKFFFTWASNIQMYEYNSTNKLYCDSTDILVNNKT